MNASAPHRPAALRRLFAAAGACLLLNGAAGAAEPVKIGYLIPLSGSATASIGKRHVARHPPGRQHQRRGRDPPPGGAQLELVEVDTRGDATVAMTEVERLLTREKTPVLLGAFQSGGPFPATAVAEKNRCYGWSTWPPRPTSLSGFKYVFRPTQIPASGNAESMADFIQYAGKTTGKPAKTVGPWSTRTPTGARITANTLRAKFKAAGIDLVLDEGYPPNSPDLRPLVLKIKGKKPDVVTVTSYGADAVQLHWALLAHRDAGATFIGSAAGQIDSTFIPLVGKDIASQVYTTNGWAGYESSITTPFAKKFWDDFVAAYKVDPNELSVSAYAAVWVIKDALERAGRADPEAIRDALAQTRLQGTDLNKLVGYDIVIDAKGQNPEKRYVMQQITADGQYRTVWPEHLASKSYKMTWPAAPAKP